MRKGQRFTPLLINAWLKEGRGTGVFDEFQPLHQVTRRDPGSNGLSRILNDTSRSRHLLSENEYIAYLFALGVPDLFDVREQFHLSLRESRHELSRYNLKYWGNCFAGTLDIAHELGIKHPRIQNRKDAPWPFSTDLLLTIGHQNQLSMLAVSVKPDKNLSKRVKELISIEKCYWEKRGVEFLLITPDTYLESVMINVTTYAPWGHGSDLRIDLFPETTNVLKEIDGLPLSAAIRFVQERFNLSVKEAQNLFWGSVWRGIMPLDLNRKATAGTPINLISIQDFWKQNPIVSRRSSWQS